ncbi:MAG: hypothetical protein AABX66_00350 [Nanoarchaeota archaeon]
MIIAIRISGMPEVSNTVQETLFRLRLRRKYSAVLLSNTKENANLLRQVRDFIAYGTLENADIVKLIQKRAISTDKKKIDAVKITELINTKGIKSVPIKPFFRLHPPRGGIDSKIHFPIKKGVLGDHGNKINELLVRML